MTHFKKLLFMITTSIGLAGLASMQACKKCKCHDVTNPACDNYDPCYGKKPVRAEFVFGRTTTGPFPINGVQYPICEDTIFSSGGVDRRGFDYGVRLKFQATESGAKYTWKLGSQTITDREFERTFITAGSGVYSAALIVDKSPDNVCFPKDDGKDTVTKKFTLVPHYKLPIMGVYKVLFDGAKDSSMIEIRPWEISEATQMKNYKIVDTASVQYTTLVNFKNVHDTVTHFIFDGFPTGNHIYFFDDPSSYNPHSGHVDLFGVNISASYYYGNSVWNTLKKYTFKGRKIK